MNKSLKNYYFDRLLEAFRDDNWAQGWCHAAGDSWWYYYSPIYPGGVQFKVDGNYNKIFVKVKGKSCMSFRGLWNPFSKVSRTFRAMRKRKWKKERLEKESKLVNVINR